MHSGKGALRCLGTHHLCALSGALGTYSDIHGSLSIVFLLVEEWSQCARSLAGHVVKHVAQMSRSSKLLSTGFAGQQRKQGPVTVGSGLIEFTFFKFMLINSLGT